MHCLLWRPEPSISRWLACVIYQLAMHACSCWAPSNMCELNQFSTLRGPSHGRRRAVRDDAQLLLNPHD
jgi:hypothetical protein